MCLQQGVRIYEGGINSKMAENRDLIEYPLAMLWRHRRAFTRKLTGFETTIVITRTILKLNSWNFLMTSTIVLLKLLMSCNNSLRFTVLSLWRSKDRTNRFVINEIWKLMSIKLLIFSCFTREIWCYQKMVPCWSKSSISPCAFIKFIFGITFF